LANPFQQGSWGWGELILQSHAAELVNGTTIVVVFVGWSRVFLPYLVQNIVKISSFLSYLVHNQLENTELYKIIQDFRRISGEIDGRQEFL
jgi:hypothetical protein